MTTPTARPSLSLNQLRWQRFRRLKRGYFSFLLLIALYATSFLLPFLMSSKAVVVRYQGNYYFPSLRSYLYDTFGDQPLTRWLPKAPIWENRLYLAEVFGQTEVDGKKVFGETNYRALKQQFASADGGDFVVLPIVPYGPYEQFLDQEGNPPYPPSRQHWMGSDDRGRDVLVRLAYGFRISISFALLVVTGGYLIGTAIGAILGYFGGWTDFLGMRIVEIWAAIPFLYTVIILSSLLEPTFGLFVVIVTLFEWIGISYYMRGEFYREKSKDYVAAAIAAGESTFVVIVKHVLPNALVPIITFAPFAIVGAISELVALDFLGFGLRPPTPSWGELLDQALHNLRSWHLVVFTLLALFSTLLMTVFIGEAVREAFDPKVQSRLR